MESTAAPDSVGSQDPSKTCADSSSRCGKCLELFTTTRWPRKSDESLDYPIIPWHPTFTALEMSAEAGCDICRLLRQALIYDSICTYEETKISKKPISLQFTPSAVVIGHGIEAAEIHCKSCQENDTALSEVRPASFSSKTRLEDIDSTIILIRKWIAKSLSQHSLGKSVISKPLPTRLLDVGDRDIPHLRLVFGKQVRSADYIAFSYCWGESNGPAKTTLANITERFVGFQLDELPTTIRDAIVLMRRLGVRYLWVDAICIIQPESDSDVEDWTREAGQMSGYYQNALFTLAATGSSDSNQGLFSARPGSRFPVRDCPLHISPEHDGKIRKLYLKPPALDWIWNINESPLYKRGWALQERLLSTRIVHMARDAMFWEDGSKRASEMMQNSSDTYYRAFLGPYAFDGTRKDILGNNWYRFIKAFMEADLRYQQDRLPAISGVASRISNQAPDEYLAGSWRETIFQGLACLRYKTSHKPPGDPFPTWSWTSASCEVRFDTYTGSISPIATLLDFKMVTSSPDPYGRVKSGTISIQGPLEEDDCNVSKDDEVVFDAVHEHPHEDLKTLMESIGVRILYVTKRERSRYVDEIVTEIVYGLILEPTGEAVHEYKRIGLVQRIGTRVRGLPEVKAVKII